MPIQIDTASYLATWAEELSARANRVRNLIGSAHWPSDGSYKEYLLLELLRRHLPNFLSSSRGFVRSVLDSEECSPEIDILVTNPARHVPLFNEGGLQIVVPSAVCATVEVKSKYSKAVLADALINVSKVRRIALADRRAVEIWSSIVFFDSGEGFGLAKMVEAIKEFLPTLPKSSIQNGIESADVADLLPQCIAVQDGGVALLGVTQGSVDVRAFGLAKLAVPLAVANLFAHVQEQTRAGDRPGELEDLLRNVDFDGPKLTLKIPIDGN